MKFDTAYKTSVDQLCEESRMPTGEELLQRAKARQDERNEPTMKKRTTLRWTGRLIAVAAASLIISATTVAAMEAGGISSLFRNLFHDETTASLADEGYVGELNLSNSDDIFSVRLDTISGDRYNPYMLLEIQIADAALAAECDTMELDVYVLDASEYDNRKEHYSCITISAIQDTAESGLYRAKLPAGWSIVNSEQAVVEICEIRTGLAENESLTAYPMSLVYRFDIPDGSLKETENLYLDNVYVDCDVTRWQMGTLIIDNYNTGISFHAAFDAAIFGDMEKGSPEWYEAANRQWQMVSADMTMTVDGVTLQPLGIEENATVGMEEFTNPCTCNAYIQFPPMGYESAQNVTLTVQGMEIVLKQDGVFANEIDYDNTGLILDYEGFTAQLNGLTVSMKQAHFGENSCSLYYTFPKPEAWQGMHDDDLYDIVDPTWNEARKGISLLVDGTEYTTISSDGMGAYYSESEPECFATNYFPAFDYLQADQVLLLMGDQTFTIKDRSMGIGCEYDENPIYPEEEMIEPYEWEEQTEAIEEIE